MFFSEHSVYVTARHKVRFLLDCGSTVNLLPRSVAEELGCGQLQPSRATIRMFDSKELPTIGMATATVRHPRTDKQIDIDLDFYITEKEVPLLGIAACRSLDMLRIVEENICNVNESLHASSSSDTSDILGRYGDLFDGSLGCMPGEVHLHIHHNVPPVQMPLRRLLIALRKQVKC